MAYKKVYKKTLEVTGIELTVQEKRIIIIALHRPLSGVLHVFFAHLIDILEQQYKKDCYIILVGDLNINTQEDGCGHRQLFDVANIHNLTMTINIPTTITESTATIIYQIITKMPAQCYSTDVINSLLSDHYEQCVGASHSAMSAIESALKNVSPHAHWIARHLATAGSKRIKMRLLGTADTETSDQWMKIRRRLGKNFMSGG
jgi:hypothetical protein